MFIPKNDIIVCKRQEPEKTAAVKVTFVLLCCSIIYVREAELNWLDMAINRPIKPWLQLK